MIGDYVLVKDEAQARGQWPTGVISKVYPGADGLVRKVQVALAGRLDCRGKRLGKYQLLERPIQKLVLLMESQDAT